VKNERIVRRASFVIFRIGVCSKDPKDFLVKIVCTARTTDDSFQISSLHMTKYVFCHSVDVRLSDSLQLQVARRILPSEIGAPSKGIHRLSLMLSLLLSVLLLLE
jgi:hypothetical protein